MSKNTCIIAVLMSASFVALSVECIYSIDKDRRNIKDNIDRLVLLENQDISVIEEEIKFNKENLDREANKDNLINEENTDKVNIAKTNYK